MPRRGYKKVPYAPPTNGGGGRVRYWGGVRNIIRIPGTSAKRGEASDHERQGEADPIRGHKPRFHVRKHEQGAELVRPEAHKTAVG